MLPIKIIRSEVARRAAHRRTLSESQLSADPDPVAAGWSCGLSPTAIGCRRRELYEQIGFEVRAEPLPGTDDPDEW